MDLLYEIWANHSNQASIIRSQDYVFKDKNGRNFIVEEKFKD
jgi:hypothetical protein